MRNESKLERIGRLLMWEAGILLAGFGIVTSDPVASLAYDSPKPKIVEVKPLETIVYEKTEDDLNEVYKELDQLEYQNELPMEGFYLPEEAISRYKLVAHHGQERLLRIANEIKSNYGEHLKEVCIKYQVPYDLAFSVLLIESGGRVDAVSHTGVKGIMQITGMTEDYIEKNYKQSGRENLIDCSASPEDNIECGVMHLKRMIEKYSGQGLTSKQVSNNAIAAYNLGRGGLNRDLRDAGKKHVLDLTQGEVRLETWKHPRKVRAYQALLHTLGFFYE